MLTFNQSVFDETKRYWTGKTINIKMAAKARLARIKTSKATNPTYQMSELGDAFTYGESAAYVVVFGDKKSGTVKRSWVEWLFGKHIFFCPCLARRVADSTGTDFLSRARTVPAASRLAQTGRAVPGCGLGSLHGGDAEYHQDS